MPNLSDLPEIKMAVQVMQMGIMNQILMNVDDLPENAKKPLDELINVCCQEFVTKLVNGIQEIFGEDTE